MTKQSQTNKSYEKMFPILSAGTARVAEAWKQSGKDPYPPKSKVKKIIGLSCGKKNGNCETYLRAAASGAEEFGVKTEIIRAAELKIKPCTGCTACNNIFNKGILDACPVKDDDVPWILEKAVLEDAAFIVAAPVYHLRSNAILMAIYERMHPLMFSHMDMLKKNKVGGIISVGGGVDGWTSFGLTMINIWTQHFIRLVDQVQVEMRDFKTDWVARTTELGRNVAKAMSMPLEEVKYVGKESQMACPVCHCDVFQVPQKLPEVYCPVCWVKGVILIENGKMKVRWSEKDIKNPRFSEYGVWYHIDHEILQYISKIDPNIMKERVKKYSAYGTLIKPPAK